MADHVVEGAGPEPGGERRAARQPGLRCGAEEIIAHGPDPNGPPIVRERPPVNAQAAGAVADKKQVRDILPYIFWPWLLVSCGVLLRRRIGGGSWKARPAGEVPPPIEFPPPPPSEPIATTADPADIDPPRTERSSPAPTPAPDSDGGAHVAVRTDDAVDRPRSRTLADALAGIAMPCDLAPLMGSGPLDPRRASFFTTGHAATTVGSALADELERLGFTISPDDERSIRAERGADLVRARLASASLDSEVVMKELHPSAPEGALVVELTLV